MIYSSVYGEDHPNTALEYANAASVYADMGNREKAKELYARSLATRKKVLGLVHPETAKDYFNIGTIWFDEGDNAQALAHFLTAYWLYEKMQHSQHQDALHVRKHLERVHTKLCIAEAFSDWLADLLKKRL